MINAEKPLYNKGDQVWIDQLFIIGEITMEIKKLVDPIIVTVAEVRGKCSDPFGYPYLLHMPEHILAANNCAKVCYWESDIICKFEDDDEFIWKVWGDQ